MNCNHDSEKLLSQILDWGGLSQQRLSPAATLWASAGRRIYALGNIDGRFRPVSNPYDLYAYGRPDPQDPLAEKLQGVWSQPVKGFAGYGCSIELGGEVWALEDAQRFTQCFAFVQFDYQRAGLQVRRRDFAAVDLPLFFSSLTLTNFGEASLDVRVRFWVDFDLEDAWFTSLAGSRNTGETVLVEGECLTARAHAAPDRWAAAAGGPVGRCEAHLLEGSSGELVCRLALEPGAQCELPFVMAVESGGGVLAVLEMLQVGLAAPEDHLAAQIERFRAALETGARLVSPDPRWNAAFTLARANLQMLEAEQPAMGRYFYAGLEMFPFWFSNDGAYSVPGLCAGGLSGTALNHVRIGEKHLDAGRVPHQISPSGRVAFAGNAPESPLWIMSIWDVYRWSGDREFLAGLFPAAWKSMFEYVLGRIDPDGDSYPSGPGMVEVEGMGEEKLDSAAYTWAALRALSAAAQALGRPEEAALAAARADAVQARFDADWWDGKNGTYAMSLKEPGNARYPVPHWAVIVPLEVGLASPRCAAVTFTTLRRDYLNRWGLKHTVGDDERVWTLPTATLSRAAYRCGEPQLGFEMLSKVLETLEHGSIGLFHELIPEGACFVQLWSAATFLRGVVEDLLGIDVRAGEHAVYIAPQAPQEWGAVALEDLAFGDHRISINISAARVTVAHLHGPAPLTCHAWGKKMLLAPGETGGLGKE